MRGKISIIIPVYNEESSIDDLLTYLEKHSDKDILQEIIVVDGHSTDLTSEIVKRHPVHYIFASKKGRAAQMNEGAQKASGEILYFLHADTLPPAKFMQHILGVYHQGYPAGCYRLSFDESRLLLKLYGWFTRFDVKAFRFGDQSLFIDRKLFFEIGCFNEDLIVMEDNEIIQRIRPKSKFIIIPKSVTTSARKYRENGMIRLQLIFTIIYILYHLGIPQSQLVAFYKNHIRI